MKLPLLLISATLTIISFTLLIFNNSTLKTPIAFADKNPRSVYIGAWVGDLWNDNKKTLSTAKLTQFQNIINKKMAIATIFTGWEYLTNRDFISKLDEIRVNGWTPLVTTNPYFFSQCKSNTNNLYKAIAQGDCDTLIRAIAHNLKSYSKPILFRFAWEMNLPSMYWSISKANSTPQDFIAAWQHIHTIFKEQDAQNIQMVLSFNTSSGKTVPYKELYPGDQYVDWVAIDGYNWGRSVSWSGWTSFNGVFKKSYQELTTLTRKPIMLSEVNSSNVGGDKAAWLQDMLMVQIPNSYPNIKAVVFFNEDKSPGEGVDWRIESSQKSITAVKSSLQLNMYKSNY